jgi:hypothetical protein
VSATKSPMELPIASTVSPRMLVLTLTMMPNAWSATVAMQGAFVSWTGRVFQLSVLLTSSTATTSFATMSSHAIVEANPRSTRPNW